MPRVSKRVQLLQAAATIVDEQGSEYLTLDAVAKKAGVSKGGLLYHFKNKFALIQGLVDHADALYRENVNGHVHADHQDQGKWARAFIEATRGHRSENGSITSGMLAAQGINSQLLQPLQDTYKEWQKNIENDGLDKVDATIIRLAVDGLWLSEIFGLDGLDEDMREKVLNRLTEYTLTNKKQENNS
ncbi:TetR/AcrR family transcriptional regulator [Staphylococcus edaphicus]|uniref:TetR family transcriptional regulator n=1 Tax=Staphylococcus edaphicus TaxID=1955013 RepID=A0A2C6VF43_9STAP|nr:TetR/AcrR family transcriptional regulator [Staphylococcus edaphicus]PHK48931.1 TetR family transcriptional regulator [Staphylococcus edaphicus]UQW81981.1 TetR/AcrR family transcriptional regulator [Staphylococcus edaphicus]